MNTLKTIYKSFLLVAIIALALTMALGVFCRIYWGGVSKPDTVPQDTVVLLGDSVGLEDITKAVRYSPAWINSNSMDVDIRLEDGTDGSCVVAFDEASRTFTAVGVGKATVVLSSRLDQAVTFTIPFETQFRAESTANWMADQAKDGVVSAEELAAVTQIQIESINDSDVLDLKHFCNLASIVIKTDGEVLHLTNTDTLPETVLFYVPQAQYGAYVKDDQWSDLSARTFPDMNGDGYTVVFELNGGELNGHTTIGDSHFETLPDGGKVEIANYNDITKTGHTFGGWAISADGGQHFSETVSGSKTVNSNLKIYALWTENEYTISYNVNGSGVSPISISPTRVKYSQTTTISSETLKRTGYTFKGWSESETATSATYSAGQSVSMLRTENNAKVQLYAVWEANEYAIYYYELSDTNYETKQSMVYDQTITIQNAVSTRTGYKFVGWTTSKGSMEVVYKPGQTIKNLTSEDDSRISLYAVWEPIQYLICYFSHGGASNLPTDHKAAYGTTVTLATSAPIREGYTFLGWSLSPTHAAEPQESLPSSAYSAGASVSNLSSTEGSVVMMYAVWKANTYKIVLNANGGSGSSITLTATYEKSMRIDPEKFTKSNYGLLGWSLTSNAKTADFACDELTQKDVINLYKQINSSNTVTLYAIWTPAYTIKYNANSGDSTPSNQSAMVGVSIKLAKEIKRTGYKFVGWKLGSTVYDAEQSVKDLTTSAGGSVTLTAEWKPITYTIRYDLNGATGQISDLSMTYDETKKVSSAPSRENYTFGGWEYDGRIYAASESVKNLTTKDNSVIVLKAIWNPK